MVAELRLYAAAGGRAVVDQTLDELGRDRAALARVARATGLHVVAGCGHYVADLQSGAHGARRRSTSSPPSCSPTCWPTRGTAASPAG